jgi:Xaa-Pro aminopeptidase
MSSIFSIRVKKALKKLKEGSVSQCLVLSSNAPVLRSHDTEYPYRQNSDFFYFTGTLRKQLTLLLLPNSKDQIVLLVPPEDKVKNVWEGAPPSIRSLQKELNARIIRTKEPLQTTIRLLKGIDSVFVPASGGFLSAPLREQLSSLPYHQKRFLPSSIVDAEIITAALRCLKNAVELKNIRRANALTSAVLYHISQSIQPGVTEYELATLIDYLYRLHEAEPAFNTIVAAGKSAATLHYHPSNKPLREGEFVLIDSGCELDMYASDITRTIPVGTIRQQVLREVYEIVLASQNAAIKKIKPGATLSSIHAVAAKELTYGLKTLGILKGPLDTLIAEKAYQAWFPHGIGHSLGIDVHDPVPQDTRFEFILEPGMVITVEPGLYFAKRTKNIPSCGVRIEDDVAVTRSGHEILSDDVFPKKLEDIALLANQFPIE